MPFARSFNVVIIDPCMTLYNEYDFLLAVHEGHTIYGGNAIIYGDEVSWM